MATSDLLSNAAETTTVNGNSIIPVASAAGQPTRNVKLSTLASVVGGLIGTATTTKNGLMPNYLVDSYVQGSAYDYIHIQFILPNAANFANAMVCLLNTDGEMCTLALSAGRWNSKAISVNVINGVKTQFSSIRYKTDTNIIDVYMRLAKYSRVLLSTIGSCYSQSSIEISTSLPDGTTALEY